MNVITVQAQLPENLIVPFLQHIRDFDTQHDPLHTDKVVLVYLVRAEMSVDAFREMCQNIDPPIEGDIAFMQVPQ